MLRRSLVRVSAALILAFAALSVAVHVGATRSVDLALADAATRGATCTALRFGYAVSPWLSAEASTGAAILLSGVVWLRTRRWRAIALVAGLLATAPVELAAKHAVAQPAPRWALDAERPECGPEGYPLRIVPTPNTYPSGSVTRLAYFATLGVTTVWKRVAAVGPGTRRANRVAGFAAFGGLIVLTSVLAWTRVTIAWHWPSDVVAGFLLGAAMAALASTMLWPPNGAAIAVRSV